MIFNSRVTASIPACARAHVPTVTNVTSLCQESLSRGHHMMCVLTYVSLFAFFMKCLYRNKINFLRQFKCMRYFSKLEDSLSGRVPGKTNIKETETTKL